MQRILLSGCNGHMGRVVASLCASDPDLEITGGIDILGQPGEGLPVFPSPAACTAPGDILLDFSPPSALPGLLELASTRRIPLVLATTGYTQEDLSSIRQAAHTIPIFQTSNFSLGVNLLLDLVRRAAAALGEGFDVEIIERHHRRKVDAPSGTALMLAEAASAGMSQPPQYIYDRHQQRRPRGAQEIGICVIRGGTITGDHSVLFAGRDEVLELNHHAASREVFAAGAVRAVKFLAAVSAPGLYHMGHLLSSLPPSEAAPWADT